MKIAIIGANGKIGRLLAKESVSRGHDTTAIVRNGKSVTDGARSLTRNLFNLTGDDLKDYDVVIDAFGVWEEDELPLHITSLAHLASILARKKTRLLVVGSAGSLYVDNEHHTRLLDSPSMPDVYKPLSTAMTMAFDELTKRKDVRWTYFSPPGVFDAQAPRTGKFRIGEDELLFNKSGESTISYADAAIALLDEAEKGAYIGKRFTAVSD